MSVHPFIVRYKEAFVEDCVLYVAMDYCINGDLGKVIKKHKELETPIPEKKIKRWLLQIIMAIKFIHDKKLIHRGEIFIFEENYKK
ncbi:hypothetical protein PFNF54_01222 [Plasmodium falciparum NF54]|uniref:non-specific serine/threonine protein kinase n=1 Tax=Plasmodium falciparum (isolate NF54) TaxID=5843 RepID=W7JYJ2_PLAFO|nr:hypothetical protein PFNF54_01222 [Plasmodium falciparum NF54]